MEHIIDPDSCDTTKPWPSDKPWPGYVELWPANHRISWSSKKPEDEPTETHAV